VPQILEWYTEISSQTLYGRRKSVNAFFTLFELLRVAGLCDVHDLQHVVG
jgi:hypothetical protein